MSTLQTRAGEQSYLTKPWEDDESESEFPLKCEACGHVTIFSEDEYQNGDLECERCASPVGDD